MQTSKFLLVIGAAMIFSAPSLLAAKPETEAQAKMREALRLKIEELNTQESPSVPPVVEAPKALEPAPVLEMPKPAIAPMPAPVAKPQIKPVAPKPVKVKAEPAKPKTVVVPVPMEVPVAAPAKAEFSEPVSDADSAAAARMKDALEKKMAELDATPAAVVVAPAPVVKTQPKVAIAPEKPAPIKAPAKPVAPVAPATPTVVVTPAPVKIEAPASPLPVTKQDRLAELLRRYKADQVTAQDYHAQRAAILAE